MTVYIALLRAINVGGTAVLPMQELKNLCTNLGLMHVRTYIQSGNVSFESKLLAGEIIAMLEEALIKKLQKPVPVILRTAAEMEAVLAVNPFPDANPSQVGVLFLTNSTNSDILEHYENSGPEEIVVSGRELYIHFPNGMGRSKLKLPKALKQGTLRNINTIQKLVGMMG